MSTSSRSSRRRQPVRSPQRRPSPARAVAPPDYSRDYAYVRRDLSLIAIIGGLLLAGMVVAAIII